MKAYTDLKQSRKLVEILPLESADTYYSSIPVREWKDKEDKSKGTHIIFKDQIFALENLRSVEICGGDTYAWSLAALLEALPEYNLQRTDWGNKTEYKIVVTINEDNYASKNYDNPIDACYEMVIRLHE